MVDSKKEVAMKKSLIIGAMFMLCSTNTFSSQKQLIENPLHLTSYTLHSVPFNSFSSCEHVVIERKFLEEDLKELEGFSKVKVLDLSPATDIKHIIDIPVMDSVLRLNLSGRPLSNFDMKHIPKVFKNLVEVDLSSAGILGSELDPLKELKSLAILNLSNNVISQKKYITSLFDALPNLVIYLSGTPIKEAEFIDDKRVSFKEHGFNEG